MRSIDIIPCVVVAALLVGCDRPPVEPEPGSALIHVFDASLLVDPPWVQNWGDPIIGPGWLVGPLGYVPCTGEDMDYFIYWAVWGKLKETPSGNTIVNTKVWYYPAVTKLVGVDSGDEWELLRETQSWNWFAHHNADGVVVQHANVNTHYVNVATGERIKGTEVVELTFYPAIPFPDLEVKRYDFRCIGK